MSHTNKARKLELIEPNTYINWPHGRYWLFSAQREDTREKWESSRMSTLLKDALAGKAGYQRSKNYGLPFYNGKGERFDSKIWMVGEYDDPETNELGEVAP